MGGEERNRRRGRTKDEEEKKQAEGGEWLSLSHLTNNEQPPIEYFKALSVGGVGEGGFQGLQNSRTHN